MHKNTNLKSACFLIYEKYINKGSMKAKMNNRKQGDEAFAKRKETDGRKGRGRR